jgi:arylsulfatase A-like enzyme
MKTEISRRHVLAGAGALGLGAGFTGAHGAELKPNIVYIMADDLGYADVSCYGRREYTTANIDRIAKEGMRFMQGYANSAVCSATRTALITGRYQYRLPIGLEEPLNSRDVGLPPGIPTLPALLKGAGYQTALIGKWHLGAAPKYGPLKSGYDHFYGFVPGASDYFNHDQSLIDGEEKAHDAGYLTTLFGGRAIGLIDEFARARQPFFLSLHFNAPHWPWEGPGDEAESRRVTAPGSAITDFDGGSLATYAKMVLAMDTAIGRVLAALEARGVASNTIVIFTSDNGGERFSDRWPFSGMKTELLEGGLRIPAIVRWPSRVRGGTRSEQVMISMDWLPTLLAAAGAAPDPSSPPDGMNLAEQLRGGAPVPRKLYWRYKHNSQEALREGDWKYLKILEQTFLFNVADDPLERANLKLRHKDIYERLVADYRAWDAAMLPLDPQSSTGGFGANELADHFGTPPRERPPL